MPTNAVDTPRRCRGTGDKPAWLSLRAAPMTKKTGRCWACRKTLTLKASSSLPAHRP